MLQGLQIGKDSAGAVVKRLQATQMRVSLNCYTLPCGFLPTNLYFSRVHCRREAMFAWSLSISGGQVRLVAVLFCNH